MIDVKISSKILKIFINSFQCTAGEKNIPLISFRLIKKPKAIVIFFRFCCYFLFCFVVTFFVDIIIAEGKVLKGCLRCCEDDLKYRNSSIFDVHSKVLLPTYKGLRNKNFVLLLSSIGVLTGQFFNKVPFFLLLEENTEI